MPLAVLDRSIDSVTSRLFQLSSEVTARTFDIAAADWDRLRVGFLLSHNAPNVNKTGSPKLRFGFSSGKTNIPPAGNNHALYVETTDAAWAAASEATDNYNYHDIVGYSGFKDESGTPSSVTTFAGTWRIPNHSGTNAWQYPVWVEIFKATKSGDNGLTFDFRFVTVEGTVGTGKRPGQKADVLLGLEETNMSDIDGNTTIAEIADNFPENVYTGHATSEVTHGNFDSFFVSWEVESTQIEVTEFYVAIKA